MGGVVLGRGRGCPGKWKGLFVWDVLWDAPWDVPWDFPWEFPWDVPWASQGNSHDGTSYGTSNGTSHGTSHRNSHGTPQGRSHWTCNWTSDANSHWTSHGTFHGTTERQVPIERSRSKCVGLSSLYWQKVVVGLDTLYPTGSFHLDNRFEMQNVLLKPTPIVLSWPGR